MFGFLKDKLKAAVSVFKKKVEEESVEEKVDEPVEVVEEKEEKKVADKKEPTTQKKKESTEKSKETTEKKKEEAEEKEEKEEKEKKKDTKKEIKKEEKKEETKKEDAKKEAPEKKKDVPAPKKVTPDTQKKKEEKPSKQEITVEKKKEETIESQPKSTEEKKGFFSRMFSFGKKATKEEEKTEETISVTKSDVNAENEKKEEPEEKQAEPIETKEEPLVTEQISEEKKEIIESTPISETPRTQVDLTETDKLLSDSIAEEDIEKEEEVSAEIKASKKLEIEDSVKDIIGKDDYIEDLAPAKRSSKEDEENIESSILEESEKVFAERRSEKKTAPSKKAEKDDEEHAEGKQGFFAKLTSGFTTSRLSEEKFNEIFWELEVALLENSVAVEVIEKIKNDLKETLVNKNLPKKSLESLISESLMNSIQGLFIEPEFSLIERIDKKTKENKPFVICFVGINGSGKTTTIAKFAYMLQKKGFHCVVAAADTFRAAAIDQLEEHAARVGFKLIRQEYNSDPAAVAFDAVRHAESKNKQVVLIDTAGRLHSNTNLMEELNKVVRVTKPDMILFVGEAITGNDCVEQAREFDKMAKLDGIILSKADIDQKGGAAISISYVLQKPILYLGVGQNYEDLREFTTDFIMESLNMDE